jgi:C4-type Zn-finger protein
VDFGEDEEEEDLYEVVCPNCQNTIVLADSVLDEGEMHCPCCNELLEFDYSELTFDEPVSEEETEAEEA